MAKMKVLHGNKSVENEQTKLYKILKELPQPDSKMALTAAQKYWWYWFGAEFLSTRKLTKVDLVHLQELAFWMDARSKAYKVVRKMGYDGLVQTFKSGATNITGHLSVIEKADKHISDISAHFGMSIRDRKRLKEKQDNPDQTNLFDELLKKKIGM
jgi:phage terminase small subunit